MYHALEVTGGWAANHVVGILIILGTSDLVVGKDFRTPFYCVYHVYCIINTGAVVVV